MNFPTEAEEKPKEKKGTMVSIDADNLLISFAEAGDIGPGFGKNDSKDKKKKDLSWLRGFSIKDGFEESFDWIKTFGKILCVYIYISRSQTINDALWHELWLKYKDEFIIETIYCPRKKPGIREKPDNVDIHLIDHSKRIISLYGGLVGHFCLMSGDSDYSSFLWGLKRKQIEVAFILGSKKSFSRVYKEVRFAGIHPATGEELVHYFVPRRPEKTMTEK